MESHITLYSKTEHKYSGILESFQHLMYFV